MNHPLYLDHNATTPILPEVVDAMLPYLREHFGNPSSGHSYGKQVQRALVHAREQVAVLIGCEPDEVIFTSGGTEANNLAIRGVAEAVPTRLHLVTTVIEHPATARPCTWLEQHGRRVTRLGVDRDGRVHLEEVKAALGFETALVTVMHSNNETGVLQPVAEVAKLARPSGTLIHTDAAQSVGKVPIDVRALDVDLLSIAGHKLYAPKGIGALYVKRGTPIAPFTLGAGHEHGMRPGTENVASIVALGVASEVARRDLTVQAAEVRRRRDWLHAALMNAVPGLALHGHPEHRLPNTLNLRFPGVRGEAILAATPEIAASTGSACHEGGERASSVILAMGVPPEEALGAVRLTLGRSTTDADVALAAERLTRSWQRLRT